MRYLKLFENFKGINSLCKKYGIGNYTINDEGTVDVEGGVWLNSKKLKELPIKFGKVNGDFDCSWNNLTSLEGCPKEVGGDFKCSFNQLTSLEGGPNKVGGYFNCSNNELTSLKGCPERVGGWFDCRKNHLSSLKGCPEKIFGDFYCNYNHLSSLEGCPKEIGGAFWCSDNQLTSLEGCPQRVGGDFWCDFNKLTIIDYLPEWIEGDIDLGNNEIRDIKVEDKNYRFYGKCDLRGNPINDLFKYWEGDLKNFILDLDLEDFIRGDGKSVDITRFEYAINGKEYNKEDITNYKLIYKE